SNAVECVAENYVGTNVRVVQRLDTHVVASAKNPPLQYIPDAECKVAEQMVNALFLPDAISEQDQLDIRSIGRDFLAMSPQFLDQVTPRIHARIGNDPYLSV